MRYISTRNEQVSLTASEAIAEGLASDGGLYLPEKFPKFGMDDLTRLLKLDYAGRAAYIMKPFLPEFSDAELSGYCKTAYGENYDDPAVAPLRFTDDKTAYLELWHGPTCAFKDMALQILPHLMTASLKKTGEEREACILVATSGDTGKAALEGFRDVEGTRIVVFYPENGVSEMQKLQMMTQAGGNVFVSAVRGNFDDAQSGVKRIFSDRGFAKQISGRGFFLSSANSINWGRLLPQIVYYFSAYCDYAVAGRLRIGETLDFCVPTGNFGNILAGWFAKKMGLPVGKLICASNVNDVLTVFFKTGIYDRNRDFFETISPSMDILISSNLERLLFSVAGAERVHRWMDELIWRGKYEVGPDIMDEILRDFSFGSCGDAETKAQISKVWSQSRYLIDTHTAVAANVLETLRSRSGEKKPTVIISTASPFKFCESVLEALGGKNGGPEALTGLTGISAPSALTGLHIRSKRFESCVAKDEMLPVVNTFLK